MVSPVCSNNLGPTCGGPAGHHHVSKEGRQTHRWLHSTPCQPAAKFSNRRGAESLSFRLQSKIGPLSIPCESFRCIFIGLLVEPIIRHADSHGAFPASAQAQSWSIH